MANGVILGQTLNTNGLLPLDGSRSMTGALNMNNQKIVNVSNGTNANDAVNFSQLSTKLNTSGGTLTGQINMGNNKITNVATPTNNNDVANKSYVDNNRGGNIAVLRNTLSGTSISWTFDFDPSFALISILGGSSQQRLQGYALVASFGWNSNLMFVYQGTNQVGTEFTNVGIYSINANFSGNTITLKSIPDILANERISIIAFGQS